MRQLGNALREKKQQLGELVTLEVGKILVRARARSRRRSNIADFAVGALVAHALRPLDALERPGHAMREQYHPLGVVGIISAFNSGRGLGLELDAGPDLRRCLHLAAERQGAAHGRSRRMTNACRPVPQREGLGALCSLVDRQPRRRRQGLVADARIPLVSFTGSTQVGRDVAAKPAARYARAIRVRRQHRDRAGWTTRTRARVARDPVRRGRHRGRALHDDARPPGARVDCRRVGREAPREGLRRLEDRRPVDQRSRRRTADRSNARLAG
ncbi:MAG: aldehyde dehydrogenase family protein [Planctomycetes bacterium]|nr:aldehyde dehydrogenase family protein [Planctomycetota bacterium]